MKIKKLKTLNEAIEEIIDDGTYSVMDHNLASSVKREAEGKEKAIELFDDKTKESALEDRDTHSKVSTPALKKMYLSESLFEEYIEESIDGNTSHAQDFVSALRSAGFGDGFDQKLKIDTYGNGGTRVEYKDQGGTFTVTITDDKVVLEGQDEGDAPFKKEFSTWEEFASEFESLYPGIPVRENKILVEDQDVILDEASYTRSDNKKMLVKPNRDPLVDVIQLTLTDGEWGYVKSPDGTVTPSLLPHLSYDIRSVGVSFDSEGRYFVRVWDVSEESLQKVAEVAKQFNREYKIGFDKYASGSKKWYCLIYLNEDTDFDDPYVDPEAEVNKEGIKGRGTKLRGNPEARHARDNEDLEDSQRYPIESPAPAQTGLAMMEDMEEDHPTYFKNAADKLMKLIKSYINENGEESFLKEYELHEAPKYVAFEDIDDALKLFAYDRYVEGKIKVPKFAIEEYEQRFGDYEDEDGFYYFIGSVIDEGDLNKKLYNLLYGYSMNEDISVNGSLMEDKISIDMIHDFKPQEGAAEETFNRVLEAGKMETLEFALEDRFPNGITTEELNKVLSEEAQWVYNQLGMKEFIIPDEDDNQ